MQIERENRTTRPLPNLTVECDEHRRSAELLDDARGDDPDHPGMPALLGEHNAIRLVHVKAGEELASAHERRAIHLLASLVQFLEIARDGVGVVLVVRQQ